jgi:hypothetical protein
VRAARPLNVAVCVWTPTLPGVVTPEIVVLAASVVPTSQVNSVPEADGLFAPVLKPWMYTLSVTGFAPPLRSVTSSFEFAVRR